MGQEIPSYVKAANVQRDLYYNYKKFWEAQKLVSEAGLGNVNYEQEKQLVLFLEHDPLPANNRNS